MQTKAFPRIGETLYTSTLPNGLTLHIVPKPGFRSFYAVFATNYGGAHRRFTLDGQALDTPAGIAHYLARVDHAITRVIILSPSGAYYESGLEPVGIWIEDDYVRAVRGGMGFAKTGGNYAASLAAQVKAHDDGYSQVLWLDGVERKYIEEVGAMNIFFKIDGKIVTPMLNGSILPGITRNSVLQICRDWGMEVEERRISVDELLQAQKEGKLEECFGTGTAAVISPVGKLRYKDEVMTIGGGKIGPVSQKLYDTVTGIQLGKLEDKFGWRVTVE